MSLRRLHLADFRSFTEACFEPDPDGTTVLTGPNGTGKTTVLEAVAYLGTQRSFRGAPRQAMVRTGCDSAVLRAELDRQGAPVLVEASLAVHGRSRLQLNRQGAPRPRDLADALPVTIFSPEDLALVQGGPAARRELLDDALVLLDRPAAALVDQVDRVLRQRAALLRRGGGRLGPETATTLDVWDERLAAAGEALVEARRALVEALAPGVAASYAELAGAAADGPPLPTAPGAVTLSYRASWTGPLADALADARGEDVRRGVTTVGPHRDDLAVALADRDARTQASQGEQRSVALSLRLGVHHLVETRRGSPPILLLDDVFSELDPGRSRALLHLLPSGQTLVTTAVPLPGGVRVDRLVDVSQLGTR